MSIETAPKNESGLHDSRWFRERLLVQAELAQRMQNSAEDSPPDRSVAEKQTMQWIDDFGEGFDSLTKDNQELQQRLMSDSDVIRDSALAEIAHLLEGEDTDK